MELTTIIGLISAACTTAAFAPQALKTIRSKQTRDLSLPMYIVLNVGIILWLVYGFMEKDIPVIAANLATFIFAFTILILKIKYK